MIEKNPYLTLPLITQYNHFSKGIPSPRCTEDEKKGDFVGTFHCNSRFLADFVTNLNERSYWKTPLLSLWATTHS
jgi:hypothetical protein